MVELRILAPGDEAVLEAFLLQRIASSMFLLGNSRAVGLSDSGKRFHGTYAAAFVADAMVGVVGHFWNGNSILEVPPVHAAELCAYAIKQSGRLLAGLLGPANQVAAALTGLGLGPTQLRLDSIESLFRLSLDELRVPSQLASGAVHARAARTSDLELLTAWRVAYSIEALNEPDTGELFESSRAAEERGIADGQIWVAEVDGTPVATSGFNASVAEAVQIGGVYTPPALRSRGYARAALAQSLLDARARGIASSLLFTGDDNLAAQHAYQALGFERIGDYRITMLTSALSLG